MSSLDHCGFCLGQACLKAKEAPSLMVGVTDEMNSSWWTNCTMSHAVFYPISTRTYRDGSGVRRSREHRTLYVLPLKWDFKKQKKCQLGPALVHWTTWLLFYKSSSSSSCVVKLIVCTNSSRQNFVYTCIYIYTTGMLSTTNPMMHLAHVSVTFLVGSTAVMYIG